MIDERMRRVAAPAAIAAAWCAGALLRLWNLRAQVLDGDELHALRVALASSVRDILFTYRTVDNCIPLTLLDRLLLDAGVRPSEVVVRLPALACGLLLLVLAPLWAWRRLGRGPAVALAWLLAVSPGLALYARIARPYAPAALLAAVAVAACESWHRLGGWRRAAAYVGAAVLAVWFHLGALPLVVAPLAVATWAGGRAGVRRVVALAACVAAALLLLLLPAQATLLPLLAAKHERLHVSLAEAGRVLALLAGTRELLPALLVWGVAAIGLARLARVEPALAAFTAVPLGVHVAATLAMAPTGHQAPVILARYLLLALPLALVPLAFACASPGARPWPWAQAWLAAAALPLLVGAGPFVDPGWWRSSFAQAQLYLDFTSPLPAPRPEVAAFYRQMALSDGRPLVEAPGSPWHSVAPLFQVHQRVHGQPVVVATWGVLVDPRLVMRNAVDLGAPALLLASRARWLVIHRSIADERLSRGWWRRDPTFGRVLQERAAAAIRSLRQQWGAPDLRAPCCAAWDLDRVRGARAAGGAGMVNAP